MGARLPAHSGEGFLAAYRKGEISRCELIGFWGALTDEMSVDLDPIVANHVRLRLGRCEFAPKFGPISVVPSTSTDVVLYYLEFALVLRGESPFLEAGIFGNFQNTTPPCLRKRARELPAIVHLNRRKKKLSAKERKIESAWFDLIWTLILEDYGFFPCIPQELHPSPRPFDLHRLVRVHWTRECERVLGKENDAEKVLKLADLSVRPHLADLLRKALRRIIAGFSKHSILQKFRPEIETSLSLLP